MSADVGRVRHGVAINDAGFACPGSADSPGNLPGPRRACTGLGFHGQGRLPFGFGGFGGIDGACHTQCVAFPKSTGARADRITGFAVLGSPRALGCTGRDHGSFRTFAG
mmetsp:Transcript_127081/g.301857  ORF Transcript_127081/g.301857 Transcript_127081/m.301857 type:complete len:109 (+) Transcript_127081:992-1318(+)